MMAIAYVGLTLGAGFASGQEIMSYFVMYGWGGILGTVLSGVLLAVAAMMTMQLGSYYRAQEHSAVLRKISAGWLARVVDMFVIFELFGMGFVMVSGAGSNLNQQFGVPAWVGSALLCVLVFITCFADINRVIAVMGAMTPIMAVAVCAASIYALATMDISWTDAVTIAESLNAQTMPNWWISAINYVSLSFSLGVAMVLVMGGNEENPRVAGYGGLFGGLMYGALLLLSALALLAEVKNVGKAELPMLQVVTMIHPWAGTVMSIIIYLMIFNTALGMYYALARRVSKYRLGGGRGELREKTRRLAVLALLLLAGFALSFLGFKNLVAKFYPIMGYVGLLVISMISWAWFKGRKAIQKETEARLSV